MSTHPNAALTENHSRSGSLGGMVLICRRELRERLPSRAFMGATAMLAALTFISLMFVSGPDTDQSSIGYTPDMAPVAADLIRAAGPDTDVVEVPDAAAAAELIATDDVRAVLTTTDRGPTVLVRSTLDTQDAQILRHTLDVNAVATLAVDSGATPEMVDATRQSVGLSVAPTQGAADSTALIIAMIGCFALVLVIVLWGSTLASSVVDEKTTRVVEVLLATLRPWQLLVGKAAAIGILGLVQLAAVGVAVLVASLLGRGMSFNGEVPAAVIVISLAALVLGTAQILLLVAALAARVERQEDLGAVLQPAFVVCLGPFAAAIVLALNSPTSAWLDIASAAPLFGPFALPMRMAVESVPGWQIAVSAVVAAATVVGVGALSGRIYSNAILRSGGRVSLKESLLSR